MTWRRDLTTVRRSMFASVEFGERNPDNGKKLEAGNWIWNLDMECPHDLWVWSDWNFKANMKPHRPPRPQNCMPMMIDTVYLYAASIAGILAVLLVRWASLHATSYLPGLRFWTLRRIVYPVLIPRRRWTSVTFIEFALLGIYIVANGVCMRVDVHGTSDLMRRSSLMSSVNTVTLLLGGRTNVLMNAFGIPLHTYYLAHHWIGRMAVVQALLHAALAISSRKWTSDTRTISGLVVGISPRTSSG
jgi:hypothetical protein